MTATAPQKASPFAVFKNSGFLRMWIAQLISTIGDSFTMIAAGIYIFRQTGSSLQVGLMLMATSIPTLFIGMIAGVFVDRYDRKKIMVYADFSRAALIALIPVLVPNGVGWLYLIVMLVSAIGTFFSPAYDSVMPEFASDEDLTAANSMMAISSFGSTAVGFAASGLLAAISIELAFYIDSISFVISGLLLVTLRVAPLAAQGKTDVRAVATNIKLGVQYVFKSSILRSLLVIGLIYAFFVGMGNTLLLPFALDELKATEFEYGLQEGLTSVGFVIGSLLLARFADRFREGVWIILSLLGMAVTYLVYSVSTSLVLAIVVITISGFTNAPYGIARRTLQQRNTDRDVRGRVSGAFMTLTRLTMLLGMAAAGAADLYGARVMMIVTALINFAAVGVAMVAPGIGRPAAQWLRSIGFLRKAGQAALAGAGRLATVGDMDRLIGRLPTLASFTPEERQAMLTNMEYVEVREGDCIVRQGEVSDSAYFILEGGAVAGRSENGQERVLEVLNPGDFFGEIAALTGVPRTANVVADKAAVLLRVPAATLRKMSSHAELNRLFMSKMTERMIRMDMIEMPKMQALDQKVLRDLRTVEPEPVPAA